MDGGYPRSRGRYGRIEEGISFYYPEERVREKREYGEDEIFFGVGGRGGGRRIGEIGE